MRYRLVAATLVALTVVPVLASCGASGGSGGSSATGSADPFTLFSGTYCTFAYQGDPHVVPVTVVSGWGTLAVDGAGGGTAEGTLNRNGVILGPSPPNNVSYTFDSDRRLIILSQGTANQMGAVSLDGTLACYSAVASGSAPGIGILGAKEGTYDDASLMGVYHLAALFYSYGIETNGSHYGTMSFDGAGAGSAKTTVNLAGTIGSPATTPLSYAVASDGTVTGDFLGGLQLRGQILRNGELVVLNGGTDPGQVPIIVVLIKASVSASNALFVGPYTVVSLSAPDSSPSQGWTSATAYGVANGTFGIELATLTLNSDGTIASTPTTMTLTFLVNPDGSAFGQDQVGSISPSGAVGVLAGGTGAGNSPQLMFFMR